MGGRGEGAYGSGVWGLCPHALYLGVQLTRPVTLADERAPTAAAFWVEVWILGLWFCSLGFMAAGASSGFGELTRASQAPTAVGFRPVTYVLSD
jgi:hypothetical protein